MKRLIAAAGYSPDEITLDGDHLRRHAPRLLATEGTPRRHGREPRRGAALPSRTTRGSAARSSCAAQDKELALLCVEAYNDWMVEEWCGDSDGRLIPLCLVPLWDVELAAAEVRRNAAPRCAGGGVQRDSRRASGCPASTPATGTRSSLPARRPARSSACTSGRARRRRRPRTTRRMPCRALIFGNSAGAMADYLFSGRARAVPGTAGDVRRVPRSAGSPTCSSAATTSGTPTAGGAAARATSRSRRRPTTTGRSTAASSRTPSVSSSSTEGRCRQHHVRDRLPAPGRHVALLTGGRRRAVRPSPS